MHFKRDIWVENFLVDKLGEKIRENFKKRLKIAKDENYYQVISEMRSIYVFQKILNISIEEINIPTRNNKNVDFLFSFNNQKIYVEVKGFRPIDYEIAKHGGSMGDGGEKIDRALRRSQNKFLENASNIVVIADEDAIKTPLYMNLLVDLKRTPEIYMNNPDYAKTSAVVILGGMYYGQQFNYKIWYNANPESLLPNNLVDIFDRYKSNA